MSARNTLLRGCAAFAITMGATAIATDTARADDGAAGGKPLIEGSLLIELQNDHAFSSDDPSAEINDMFTTTELGVAINLTEILSIQALGIFEPVLDPAPFDDRFFEDHGAYFEELYLQIEFDGVRIFLGKFDPSFGTAWDAAPGIYGVDFAEDYELVERIGGGAAITFGDPTIGTHTLQGNVFFADTSGLSSSIFETRRRNRLSFGGASNTESIESISVTLAGEAMPWLDGVTYNLGVRHQARGMGDVANERGFVAGLQREIPIDAETTFTGLVEGVYLDHAFGGPDDLLYLTLGGVIAHGPWNLSGSWTLRETQVDGGSDFTDHLAQVSAGYEFAYGITFDAGYRYAREMGIETHIFGVLVTKEFGFAHGQGPLVH